jgi:hypothetical protein
MKSFHGMSKMNDQSVAYSNTVKQDYAELARNSRASSQIRRNEVNQRSMKGYFDNNQVYTPNPNISYLNKSKLRSSKSNVPSNLALLNQDSSQREFMKPNRRSLSRHKEG